MGEQFWLTYGCRFSRSDTQKMSRRERESMLDLYIEDLRARRKTWSS